MSDKTSISLEEFATLVRRAGMSLNPEELELLKPTYEIYMAPVEAMQALDLDAEDLALTYIPDWEPKL
jgi:hypothetical protein